MARPPSVRHPISRPHLVPGSAASSRAFPAAADQIQRARERLRASGNAALADNSPEPQRELDDVHEAARRRVANAKPKTPSEQIIANQEEIMLRLTAIASQLSRTSRRQDRVEEELFGIAGDPGDPDDTPDPDAPAEPSEPPAESPAAAPDPSESPTQPLDPPPADPAEPELPAPAPEAEPEPDAG